MTDSFGWNENEGEVQRVTPEQALYAAEMMHLYVHVLEKEDMVNPEDTVFLQINLQEELLLHAALSSYQIMNACLDDVVNGFLRKMAEATGVQKEGAWIERLNEAKSLWMKSREREDEPE